MIADARTFPDSPIDADIVVVGTGPAGVAVATTLLGTGRRIVMLEAGDFSSDVHGQQQFWSAGNDLASTTHYPLHLYRRRVFGGTSTVWGGRCLPLDPLDFRPIGNERPDAWPIGYEEMAGYYPVALDLLDAGANEFDAGSAFGNDRSPAMNLGFDRVERFSLPTNFARKFHPQLSNDKNVVVLVNAPCVEILTEPGGSAVSGARCRVGDRDLIVRSRIVVLANGGLEAPRLMLASNAVMPTGVGNENDLVGRFYMTHFAMTCGRVNFKDELAERAFRLRRTRDGIYGQRIIQLPDALRERAGVMNFAMRASTADAGDPDHHNAALSTLYLARHLFKNQENTRRYETPAIGERLAISEDATLRHAANILGQLPSAAGFAVRRIVNRYSRRRIPTLSVSRRSGSYPLEFNGEQAPQRDSRISLGSGRDPLGMPLLNVDWRVSDVDRKAMAASYELTREVLAKTGRMTLDYTEDELQKEISRVRPCGGHHIGTTRMSASPRDGVVDPDCQVWSTKGLYVASSSVFPTGGYANPTLSIVAMALRLAEHLKTAGR